MFPFSDLTSSSSTRRLALRAGRAWLRRYEAQRVADTVVSSTFLAVLLLLAVLVVEVGP